MKRSIIKIVILFLLSTSMLLSQENAPTPSDTKNWISSISFDLNGNTVAKGVSYFNTLGKATQSQSWDIQTNKIWNTEVRYDSHGRPALQTLSAPIGNNFGYSSSFIRNWGNSTYTTANFESNPENPSPVAPTTSNTLGHYYSNNNSELYQDVTSYPFSRTLYSKLIPGAVKAVVGGNKIDTDNDGAPDRWLQSYSFSMPAAQELSTSVAFADSKYNNHRISKTVMRDVHGIETVVFTDTDGNTLATARSGNEEANSKKYEMTSYIKEQGFVDIHIPVGCSGVTITNEPGGHQLKVYDLISERPPVFTTWSSLPSGFYRFSFENTVGPPYVYNPSSPITIRYQTNYYDYSLNTYDKAGRLLESTQPLGKELTSTFKYNSLGQLLETTSPDEGAAQFKYRTDGQIRYSQNSKQAANGEFSYTNYDDLARPIESGVLVSNAFSTANSDSSALPSGIKKEQHFTRYDITDTTLAATLTAAGISPSLYKQQFVYGNVSKTWTNNPLTATTWYSYDIYGRVTWLVQDIEGLGIKTIDYEYDFAQGYVTKVSYQKNSPSEAFYHRYTYNVAGQLTEVNTSENNHGYTKQAEYFYYETGALKRTEIADGLQGIDYVYNLSGQLKAINHPALVAAKDPGNDANDLFGMQLDYYSGDYARTQRSNITSSALGTNQYNGNIKGIAWNTDYTLGNDPVQYTYEYNRNNWLTDANFNANGNTQSIAADVVIDYTVDPNATIQATNSITFLPGSEVIPSEGSEFLAEIVDNADSVFNETDYQVSGITYDANGNIKTLTRNKNTEDGSNAMDNLNYVYKTDKPNQLLRVEDAVGDAGVQDIDTQTGENYVYNSIGQLISNIGDDTNYTYNASGLVTEVKKESTGDFVKFYYDDKGKRVRKESYNATTRSTNKTYYVRDAAGSPIAIYQKEGSTATQLKEQPIYGASRLGIHYRQDGTDAYQLTDHLGNVRAVIVKNGTNAAAITAKTDYYPGGMAMPNRNIVGDYRYNYQGQEKDGETGMEAFELRLWDSRIGRWLTTDPYGQYSSPYLGMGNNPINGIDIDGGIFILKGLTDEQKKYWNSYIKKIKSTEYGRRIYNTVENSPHEVHVVWRYGTNKKNGRLGDFFFADDESKINKGKTTLSFSNRLSIYENQGLALERKHGGSNWKHPIDVVLGHEIFHAYLFIKKSKLEGIDNEHEAVKFQNYLYRANGGLGALRNGYLDSFGGVPFLSKVKGNIKLPNSFHSEMFFLEKIIIPQRLDNFPGRTIKIPRKKSCGC